MILCLGLRVEIVLRNKSIRNIAIGGILAGVAMVVMCLGGLVPFATYICPVLCILTCNLYLRISSLKLGFVWYVSVSVLSLLLAPDRESAVIYVFLGAYPCIKGMIDKLPLRWIWKLLYFNLVALASYWVSVYIMGLSETVQEFQGLGSFGLVVIFVLSNATFVLLDHLLSKFK
jgi:hypothetical protein